MRPPTNPPPPIPATPVAVPCERRPVLPAAPAIPPPPPPPAELRWRNRHEWIRLIHNT